MRAALRNGFTPLLAVSAVFTLAAADWPQWHGLHRDRHTAEPALAQLSRLPAELKAAWKIPTGPGHASPVVAGPHLVYVDEDGTSEVAHCLDASTGAERWKTAYGERSADEWGAGPRSTPFIEGNRVFVQSCRGEFRCLDLGSGRVIWGTSFAGEYGVAWVGPVPNDGGARHRGHNGAGIVDGAAVIVPVGATNGATLVAFAKDTGRVLWKAGQDATSYASLVVAPLAGRRQVVAFTADALMGVGVEQGEILWRVPFKTVAHRHCCTPVVSGDTVFVSSFTFGLAAVRVRREGEACQAAVTWRNPELKINLATPTLVDGDLYTQGAARDLVCVDAATGTVKWSQPGFGGGGRDYASIIAAGRKLLVLSEDGTLLLLEADPGKYTELGRLQVCGGTWTFPALADGRLYVRDGRGLLCVPLAD